MLINGRYRATPKSVQQVFEKCCFLQCHSLITLMRHTHTKNDFHWRHLSTWSLPHSPRVCMFLFFSPGGGLYFPPTSQRWAPEANWRVYSIPVWVSVCEHAQKWNGSILARIGSCLRPMQLGIDSSHPRDPKLELAVWKIIFLFFFIFLKCMCNSQLFQCLILGVFRVFT